MSCTAARLVLHCTHYAMHRLGNMIHRIRRLVRRYMRLRRAERRALWRAAWWIVVVRSALEVMSFRRVLRHVERRSQSDLQNAPSRPGLLSKRPPTHQAERGANHETAGRSENEREAESGTEKAPHPSPALQDPEAARTIWAIGAVGRRLMPERPCLTQALVGRLLLAREGVDATLHIGVTKEESALKAHAWLEQGDVVILGGDRSREEYRAFPALNG